jgi:hypothetical protein|tara:strand:- start:14 stop:253 length:240 start_codon:yes stop_codon:yes gene_type:complete
VYFSSDGIGLSLSFSLAGSALDDVVDADDHLSSFGSGKQNLLLDAEAFNNATLLHVTNFTSQDVDTRVTFTSGVRSAHL